MAGKSFSVSFNIQGSLDGSLQAALKAAANSMRALGNAAKTTSAAAAASKSGLAGMANSLNQLSTAAQRYKQLQDALKQSTAGFAQAGQALSAAKAKYEADAAAVEKLKQKLLELRQAQTQAATAKSSKNAALKQMRQDLAALKRAYAEAKRAGDQLKLTTLDAQIKSTQGALSAQQSQVRAAAQAYKELSEQVKRTKADLQAANAAAQKSGQDLSAQRTNTQRLSQSFQSQLAALNQLKASLSSAGFNLSNFGASESRLAAEIDRVNAALQRQQQLVNAQRQSSAASQEMFNAYNNFQGALNTAEQIAAPFKSAIDKSVEFERVMSEVKALTQMDNIKAGRTDVIEREMTALTAQAKELGATTIYTAQQVGEAQAYIARTGWQTNQILASTPHFLKLAASGHMDMARAADIATNIMTGFGISAENAEHVADVLAYTTTHSNQNLEEMGEAMKYAAPVAKMFGASLEETAAMTKFMADAGIKGSMAGTSLRQTMLRLVAPPKKASKAMESMGLTVDDATAAWQNANAVAQEYGVSLDASLTPGRQMLSIIKQLDKNMAGASSHEKMAAFSAITGVNAVSGAMNVFEAGADALNEFTTALENCDGALEQTYGVMTQNTYGALKSLESAWEAVQLSVGSAISPIVQSAAESFTPLVTATAEWIDQHPAVVQAAAAIAAALATIVVGAAAVKLAFAGWTFVTSSITMVQAALATLADGALLGGLVARLTALRTALFGLGGAATLGGWSAMFAAISTKAAAAATAIRAFFASLTLGSVASGIASTISSIGTAIAGAARAAMAFAFSPVGVALMALALAGAYVYQNWDKVSAVLSNVASVITGSLSSAIAAVQPAIQGLMAAFEALGSSGLIQGLIDTLGQGLVLAIATVVTGLAGALATVINVVAQIAAAITNVVSGIVNTISNVLSGNWTAAWESAKATAIAAFEGIGNVATAILDGIKSTVEAIGTAWNFITGDAKVPEAPTSAATTQAATVMPEVQPIDTSATQAALDQVGDAAANAATNMDGVNQASQMLSQAGDGAQALAQNMTQAGAGVETFSSNTQTAGSMVQAFGQQAQTSQSSVQALGNSSQQATGGIDAMAASAQNACAGTEALGSAASSAAGAVSGLGAAAQAACQQLAQAGANAAAAVASAAAGVGKPAANYQGGIYKKGAFLTTFAEKSPEAAIPLDGSKRAQDLWTRAGEMLGLLPSTGTPPFDPTITAPPFNPDIKLPKGQEISARIHRELPPRDELRRQKMPEFYSKFPTQPRRAPAPTFPKINFPTPKAEPSMIEQVVSIATPIIEKFSPKVGGIIRDISNAIFAKPTPQIQATFPTGTPIDGRREPSPFDKIYSPTPTFPTFPSLDDKFGLGDILERGGLRTMNQSASPTEFNVTIHVNVSGNADEATVKRGVEQAIPSLNDWARNFAAHQHDAARRSFA